jgi:transcriptional regulator with XRE-family HTH domain
MAPDAVRTEAVRQYFSGTALMGQRIRAARERLGLSQAEFGARLNDRLYDHGLGRWGTGSSISRLEKNHPQANKLTDVELTVFVDELSLSKPYLLGWDKEQPIVPWDALTNPAYAAEFFHHLKLMEEGALEFIGWGESLPCSIETDSFMRAHHDALFKRRSRGLSAKYMTIALENYNAIGARRRRALVEGAAARSWSFIHCTFRSDLEAIAEGREPYSDIGAWTRAACLDNLRQLVVDRGLKIDLIICEDESLRSSVAFADTIVCIDHRFAFWRDHQGSTFTSTDTELVGEKRRLLEQLRTNARLAEPDKVAHFLAQQSEGVRQ